MAKEKPKDPPTLVQRMRRIADKGHPMADELRAAADVYEKASNEFHADRELEARSFELAWQGIETPELAAVLAKWTEARRVLSKALEPPPGIPLDWFTPYE
jgi:hypothetical protein